MNLPWPESEDIALNLEISDLIRSKTVLPKSAVLSLKTRLASKNGRVQMSVLGVSSLRSRVHISDTAHLDVLWIPADRHMHQERRRSFSARNCWKRFCRRDDRPHQSSSKCHSSRLGCHARLASLSVLCTSQATIPQVREMALSLFQQWAFVFETKSNLSYLPEMYRELKSEGQPIISPLSPIGPDATLTSRNPKGVGFPPAPAAVSSHLLTTATPPNWIDSESCMRCRTPFTFTNRKHHCRNCGLVFDQACSSKAMPLPHLGITQDVRVCEPCFSKSNRGQLSK